MAQHLALRSKQMSQDKCIKLSTVQVWLFQALLHSRESNALTIKLRANNQNSVEYYKSVRTKQ